MKRPLKELKNLTKVAQGVLDHMGVLHPDECKEDLFIELKEAVASSKTAVATTEQGCIKMVYGAARVARMCSLPQGHDGGCVAETESEKEERWAKAKAEVERKYREMMDAQPWVRACSGIEIRGPQAEEIAQKVGRFIEDERMAAGVRDNAERWRKAGGR